MLRLALYSNGAGNVNFGRLEMDEDMYRLDMTLPTPEENVALDEALLDAAEAGEIDGPVLRLWESSHAFVVLGRSSKLSEEVDVAFCKTLGIPVVRRASGGAAVVAGPGCLMYALVQPFAGDEHLRQIDELHRHVLGRMREALSGLAEGVEHAGTCDLAVGKRKFSGNAVRCKRDHFLYHGTILYDFDLNLIQSLLGQPQRQPEYRAGRRHADFLMNLGVTAAAIREAVLKSFGADRLHVDWPRIRVTDLVARRYGLDAWNFER
jgi:lipoate-protein ligase A